MREPIVINAWMTVADAREAGISTSSPRGFRINAATGTLHKASCSVLDRVSEKDQTLIEHKWALTDYLHEKSLKLDEIKCGICCRHLSDDLHFGVGETIPNREMPWMYRLKSEKREELYNRLMVEHYFEVEALRDILSGDAMESHLDYRRFHGEDVTPFDEDIQQSLMAMFLEMLDRVSRFMERERRLAKKNEETI